MGAAAALLGGIIVWGSNNNITQEARKEMVAAEAKQAALIETIGLRAVPWQGAPLVSAISRPMAAGRVA